MRFPQRPAVSPYEDPSDKVFIRDIIVPGFLAGLLAIGAGVSVVNEDSRTAYGDVLHSYVSETPDEAVLREGLEWTFGERYGVRCADIAQDDDPEKTIVGHTTAISRSSIYIASLRISSEACEYALKVNERTSPFVDTMELWGAAHAVSGLAHEGGSHLSLKDADESDAVCHEVQLMDDVAEGLGASEVVADQLQRYIVLSVNATAPQEYITDPADCRDGGRLDLKPHEANLEEFPSATQVLSPDIASTLGVEPRIVLQPEPLHD